MQNLEQSLQAQGFSDKAAKIYIALLQIGEGSVIDIAKKAELKRTTVYNILPDLIRQGLVESTVKNKHHIFFIDDVRRLELDAQEKVKSVGALLPQLKAIQNILPQKPKITFYEGVGGMKELYQDTLDSMQHGGTILSYTGLTDFFDMMPKEYYAWYVEERAKKKILIKIIAPDSPITRQWAKDAVKDVRQMKIIPSKDFRFKGDTEIYANKVALISYAENFLGVIIESKEIHEMQKTMFELLWDSLS
ncbi:hypothetical protein HZA86_03350 [Candidatus Uhrbacteria bacterium]|nr:hypothetical protein [Candidatus Uhrbacteria bacterium]